jgi:hypothetical protein
MRDTGTGTLSLAISNYDSQHTKDPVDYIKKAVINSINLEVEKRRRQKWFRACQELLTV